MKTWVEFWDRQEAFGEELLRWNMEVFVRGTERLLGWSGGDVVLDVGCGPGLLASFLKDRVREVHLADTSQRCVRLCRERFREDPNVHVHRLDPGDPTALSRLPARDSVREHRDHGPGPAGVDVVATMDPAGGQPEGAVSARTVRAPHRLRSGVVLGVLWGRRHRQGWRLIRLRSCRSAKDLQPWTSAT